MYLVKRLRAPPSVNKLELEKRLKSTHGFVFMFVVRNIIGGSSGIMDSNEDDDDP